MSIRVLARNVFGTRTVEKHYDEPRQIFDPRIPCNYFLLQDNLKIKDFLEYTESLYSPDNYSRHKEFFFPTDWCEPSKLRILYEHPDYVKLLKWRKYFPFLFADSYGWGVCYPVSNYGFQIDIWDSANLGPDYIEQSFKKIDFKPALSLVIGNIIGVGIFTTTGYVANYLDSPVLIFLCTSF